MRSDSPSRRRRRRDCVELLRLSLCAYCRRRTAGSSGPALAFAHAKPGGRVRRCCWLLVLLVAIVVFAWWYDRATVWYYIDSVREPIAYVTLPLREPDPADAAMPRLTYWGLGAIDEHSLTRAQADALSTEDRAEICRPYAWPPRPASGGGGGGGNESAPPSVVYVVLYNGEADMLLLLLHTVGDALGCLVVSEAPVTHSGKPKGLPFAELLAAGGGSGGDFAPWVESGRLFYAQSAGAELLDAAPGGPFAVETAQRDSALRLAAAAGRVAPGDWVLVGDVDELPRPGALWLLQLCAPPDSSAVPLSLGLRKYYYSFEWQTGLPWGSVKATRFSGGPPGTNGEDGRRGGRAAAQLSDAGWHCSWCFPRLADFAVKAHSYAHTEHDSSRLLAPDRLQAAVCEGRDFAGRWGEYRHWRDMLRHLPGEFVRQRSVVGLPPALLRPPLATPPLARRFRHLLPGACVREDYAGAYVPPAVQYY